MGMIAQPIRLPASAPSPYEPIGQRSPARATPMNVVKRNKRLYVEHDGAAFYTPPDFVRLHSREPLHALAIELTKRPYIDAVMDFEARCARRATP